MGRTDHFVSGSGTSYRGSHQPPAEGGAAPLHDLTAHGSFPNDVYTHPHYYGHGDSKVDAESSHVALSRRGKPEQATKIYRAAPAEATHINTGDWVTTSRTYAQNHSRHPTDPSKDMPVHTATVPAKHLTNGGNDLVEWGYHGPAIQGSKIRTKKG